MIYEAAIEDLLLDHGLVRRALPNHVASNLQQMVADLHTVMAYEFEETMRAIWGDPPDHRWSPADVRGVEEDELYQDVHEAVLYRLWREEIPELDLGHWNTLDAETRRSWRALTVELILLAEDVTRGFFRELDDDETVSTFENLWEFSHWGHPMLQDLHKSLMAASGDPYTGPLAKLGDDDEPQATAVEKAIMGDVAQHEPGAPAVYAEQLPKIGDTLYAVVSGKEVPVRILAKVGYDTYDVQSLVTGRKMRRDLHQLRSESHVQRR